VFDLKLKRQNSCAATNCVKSVQRNSQVEIFTWGDWSKRSVVRILRTDCRIVWAEIRTKAVSACRGDFQQFLKLNPFIVFNRIDKLNHLWKYEGKVSTFSELGNVRCVFQETVTLLMLMSLPSMEVSMRMREILSPSFSWTSATTDSNKTRSFNSWITLKSRLCHLSHFQLKSSKVS